MDVAALLERYEGIMKGYALSVVDDSTKACEWIRLATRRTLDDLKHQDDGDFPWRFDQRRAFRACAFIEALPHTKGHWAMRREKLKLSPWQIWVTASIFGWVSKETGKRRYRRALILVPRKNGKSAWAAGIGLYMACADGEFGAEVYSGATSERQAHEVFQPARQMVERTPRLAESFNLQTAVKAIVSPTSGSRFEPVVAKPGDGSSPSCAIIDEYHEHQTDHMVETFRTGMGARSEPLLLTISTAGDNIGGPCHAAMLDAQDMLRGIRKDDDLFAALYGLDEGDDWTTDEALIKANPNYGVSVNADFLRRDRDNAKETARRQGSFRTKHLNEWVGARSAFFNMQNWAKCRDDSLKIEDFRGKRCWIGVDFGAVSDATSAALVFPRPDEKFAVFFRTYLPAIALNGPNRIRYKEFLAESALIPCGESMVDQDQLEEDLRTDLTKYSVRAISVDPHNTMAMMGRLERSRAPVIQFPKNVKNVSLPMKQLAGLIDDGRIIHDGNPVASWMIGNVESYMDAKDNVFSRKPRAEAKIDACDALIAAFALFWAAEAEGERPERLVMVV